MIEYLVIGGGSIFVIAVVLVIIFVQRHKHTDDTPKGSARVLASSLRDEKLKSGIILDTIEDGVVLLDSEQTIQLFNPAASTLTGWDGAHAIGLSYKSVFNFMDDKGVPFGDGKDPFTQVFESGISVHVQSISLQTQSESVIMIDMRVTPLHEQGGTTVQGAVGVFRDVSQQRKEEAQRAEFISTASHEMRTPVAAIEGYLALALNDKVSSIDDKARGYLQKAHDSTQHLGQLFQDLLTSAKAEDGRIQNHPSVVELGSFLESLTDGLKFSAQAKKLAVEYVLGAQDTVVGASETSVVKPLYYAHLDPDRMREVITNLFDNAVKYTDTGKITIGLTGDESIVQIRITDTGNGIPSEDIPHLFQKFYRVDNSTTRTVGGTGLGLFICRKIVEIFNGRIWVESELGKGTTFFINVPRISTGRAVQLQHDEQVAQSNTSVVHTP